MGRWPVSDGRILFESLMACVCVCVCVCVTVVVMGCGWW